MTAEKYPGLNLELVPQTEAIRDRGRTWSIKQRMAMNQMTTYRWSFDEDVIAYREAGIRAIGVWRQKLDDFGDERAADLLLESGLTVASLSWAGGFTGSDGSSYRDSMEDARDAIRVAAEIQAECLVVLPGGRAGHTRNHGRRLVVDALRELGDLAGEQNLQIALQPIHPGHDRASVYTSSLDKTLDLLANCNHAQVGMALDLYHLWRETDLCGRAAELLPWIKTVQVSDSCEPPSLEQDRCLLGHGQVPWMEIVSRLDQAGYQGFYDIQILADAVWNSDYHNVLEKCRTEFQLLCHSYPLRGPE